MTLATLENESLPLEHDLAHLVRRYGGPVSGVLLDPEIEIFRAPGIDGAIAYRTGFGCAVAVGDPVCERAQMAALAEAFREECRRHGWHSVYTVASDRFGAWATQNGFAAVELARELIVDPRVDPLRGHAVQRLRGKVHRAEHEGVMAAELPRWPARDPALEQEMERAVSAWLSARKGPQIYLTPLTLFAGRACKRWFHAKRGGDVIGVMQLVRLDAYDGYLISQLIATPDAPPGTTELLAAFGLRALGAEGCAYVTWGPTPLADIATVTNLGTVSEKIGRAVFHVAGRIFHLDARSEYRRKFPVAREVSSYLLFDPPRIGAREAIGILRAFHAFHG
jgi:aspartyl-tRNA synthetase